MRTFRSVTEGQNTMTMTELLETIRKAAAGAAELAETTENARLLGTLLDIRLSLGDCAGWIELELEDAADVA